MLTVKQLFVPSFPPASLSSDRDIRDTDQCFHAFPEFGSHLNEQPQLRPPALQHTRSKLKAFLSAFTFSFV